MTIDIIIIALGLLFSALLFFRFPELRETGKNKGSGRLSVIIPVRNEERNLPLILDDLLKQNEFISEIICVDDGSVDKTAKIAGSYGVTLITAPEKPDCWTGKSWACHHGAEAASGELFIFIDADVRLNPDGINRLIRTYEVSRCVLSVQPYHKMYKRYEQLSLFFNLIQIAANGLTLFIKNKHIGLYGPVILIGRADYCKIGGHASVRDSITDDLSLGRQLKSKSIPFRLFTGGKDISFRMYGGGMKDLFQGWSKNQAAGAIKTPLPLFVMVFFWVTSCASVPIQLAISAAKADFFKITVFLILYLIWVLELKRICSHVGNFKFSAMMIYPIYLVIFLWVLFISSIKRLFHLNVIWKERKIRSGK